MRREILGCTSTREDGVYPTNVNIKNKITKIGKNTIKIVQKHYLELKTTVMTKPTIVGRQQRKIKLPITIDNDLDSPCVFFGNLDSCRLLTYFGRVSLECLTPYRGIDYFPISTTRKSISKILITCLWIKSRSMGCGGEDDQTLPLLLKSSKFLSIPIS